MGLFNFFKKKEKPAERIGGMEDFMTLIRVYYQSVLAANLGITNINMLPDLATFKRTLKVPTQNNKLGLAERGRCKKMIEQIYGMDEIFFKETELPQDAGRPALPVRIPGIQQRPDDACRKPYEMEVPRSGLYA